MAGQKRDYNGKAKEAPAAAVPAVRNELTSAFEWFRDELDEHYDRRERIVKASRDITALSKKIIFSLQRVRKIHPTLPANIDKETQSRLAEITKLLATIAPEVQGINRYRYARNMSCIEELIEALTFAHYLRTQTIMGYTESIDTVAALAKPASAPALDVVVIDIGAMDVDAAADEEVGSTKAEAGSTKKQIAAVAAAAASEAAPVAVHVTTEDYLGGIFDLSGEIMRFATTSAALNGTLDGPDPTHRTIVADMQELGSMFEILPKQYGRQYGRKLETLRQSVLKVEKLGYGLKVRGSERPAGWMPDTSDVVPLWAGEEFAIPV